MLRKTTFTLCLFAYFVSGSSASAALRFQLDHATVHQPQGEPTGISLELSAYAYDVGEGSEQLSEYYIPASISPPTGITFSDFTYAWVFPFQGEQSFDPNNPDIFATGEPIQIPDETRLLLGTLHLSVHPNAQLASYEISISDGKAFANAPWTDRIDAEFSGGTVTVVTTAVPEPGAASCFMLGTGTLWLARRRWRKEKAKQAGLEAAEASV